MSDVSIFSNKNKSNEVVLGENPDDSRSTSQYQIKPSQQEGFQPHAIKEIISNVLIDVLDGECMKEAAVSVEYFEIIIKNVLFIAGKQYQSSQIEEWTSKISDTISTKVKELNMRRYKHIVQVVIVQQTGAGCR